MSITVRCLFLIGKILDGWGLSWKVLIVSLTTAFLEVTSVGLQGATFGAVSLDAFAIRLPVFV